MSKKDPSRRDFVETTAKAAIAAAFVPAGFPTIVPRHVLGGVGFTAPSDQLNFAVVGFGGMGSGNAQQLVNTGSRLVAVCDVDPGFADRNVASKEKNRDGSSNASGAALRAQFDKAAKYRDFREMLDKSKDIDGVVIATPDHNHAIVAKSAMQLGKHVYVQKPLTTTVHEARVLAQMARDNPKIATQMGNQGHSREGTRSIVEWVQAGLLGDVREVHVWTNRPVGYWPQGIPRPSWPANPANASFRTNFGQGAINNVLAAQMAAANFTVPDGLRWDLYLGGCPEDIAYHPAYHPFNWRGWLDFGVGALGDMGAHLIDQPYWALGLTQPVAVEASSTPWGTIRIPPADPTAASNTPAGRATQKQVTYPVSTQVHYDFPARGKKPAVKLHWYDGGLLPPRPAMLPIDVPLNPDGGVLFVGDKGVLMHETYGDNPKMWPDELNTKALKVPKTVERITVSHEENWANAARGMNKSSSPFEYASALTETMLLGVTALRAGQGKTILYDAAKGEITNAPDANAFLTREYRKGWAV